MRHATFITLAGAPRSRRPGRAVPGRQFSRVGRAVRGRRGPPRHPRSAPARGGPAPGRERQADELRRATEENSQLRRSLLDLQTQIEAAARRDRPHARPERAAGCATCPTCSGARRTSCKAWTSACARSSPPRCRWTAREFIADPTESRDFEAALAIFRRGEFPAAQAAFADFIKRYPQSGFRPTALFWLGNAQYANRDYRGAIANFRALLAQAPDHPRAAEAVLSIANCQIELKDNAGRAPHAGRADQGLSAVRGGAWPPRNGWRDP